MFAVVAAYLIVTVVVLLIITKAFGTSPNASHQFQGIRTQISVF